MKKEFTPTYPGTLRRVAEGYDERTHLDEMETLFDRFEREANHGSNDFHFSELWFGGGPIYLDAPTQRIIYELESYGYEVEIKPATWFDRMFSSKFGRGIIVHDIIVSWRDKEGETK